MSKTHQMSGTRLYSIWKSMQTRCNNPNSESFKNYGARGIAICDEWGDFVAFHDWAVNNGYSDSLTIERIDVNVGYCPENCKWIPKRDQAKNRRNTVTLIYNGKRCSPSEISEMTGISVNSIYSIHRDTGITDFSNYKPRHSKHRNICKRPYGYEVNIKGKYIGSYVTIEEAVSVRDAKKGSE